MFGYGVGGEEQLYVSPIIQQTLDFFAYFTILEYVTSRSVGKMILGLRVVGVKHPKPDLKGGALSIFGKSFMHPFDLILGYLLIKTRRQRIFRKLGETQVLKLRSLNSQQPKYEEGS